MDVCLHDMHPLRIEECLVMSLEKRGRLSSQPRVPMTPDFTPFLSRPRSHITFVTFNSVFGEDFEWLEEI